MIGKTHNISWKLLCITLYWLMSAAESYGTIKNMHKDYFTKSKPGIKKIARSNDDPPNTNCWMTMDASKHFKAMQNLEEMYSKTKDKYINETSNQTTTFDMQMLNTMLQSRGRIESNGVHMDEIPAGLNLGGYTMLKNEKSVLFFHRMKLRNTTKFRINMLKTDLGNMVLKAQLSLHDLHLLGSYERAFTDQSPSNLYYIPTFGIMEILLKDVVYVVTGRLRFLHNNPYIVLVTSQLDLGDAMLMHKKNTTTYDTPMSIRKSDIEIFLDRLKSDLDSWLRDYFNHHLIFYSPIASATEMYREFQKKRTIVLNEYVERSLKFIKHKLHSVKASTVKLPTFNIIAVDGMKIQLADGILRGLDTIYRRSTATGYREDSKIRKVDAIVGFSNLKVVYKYTTHLKTGVPPLSGLLTVSADELTAQMSLTLTSHPEAIDLNFQSVQELKDKSVTVEGPANRMIANFKHILEHHILTIVSNVLIHNIKALSTLTKCEPSFYGIDDLQNDNDTENEENQDLDKSSERVPHLSEDDASNYSENQDQSIENKRNDQKIDTDKTAQTVTGSEDIDEAILENEKTDQSEAIESESEDSDLTANENENLDQRSDITD